jgi:hypothetical protein
MIAGCRRVKRDPGHQPDPVADQVDFIRQQLAAVSANMVPYHLMTGDVSQANYSSLRAAMNGLHDGRRLAAERSAADALPARRSARRMQVSAMRRNDPRFLASNGTSRCRFAAWSTRSRT